MKKKYIIPIAESVETEDVCNDYWKPGWSWQNPSGTWHQEGGWAKENTNPIWDEEINDDVNSN